MCYIWKENLSFNLLMRCVCVLVCVCVCWCVCVCFVGVSGVWVCGSASCRGGSGELRSALECVPEGIILRCRLFSLVLADTHCVLRLV